MGNKIAKSIDAFHIVGVMFYLGLFLVSKETAPFKETAHLAMISITTTTNLIWSYIISKLNKVKYTYLCFLTSVSAHLKGYKIGTKANMKERFFRDTIFSSIGLKKYAPRLAISLSIVTNSLALLVIIKYLF